MMDNGNRDAPTTARVLVVPKADSYIQIILRAYLFYLACFVVLYFTDNTIFRVLSILFWIFFGRCMWFYFIRTSTCYLCYTNGF